MMKEIKFNKIRKKSKDLADAAYLALSDYKGNAIYEDTIVELCGYTALTALKEFHLIEGCGTIDGRKLYAV